MILCMGKWSTISFLKNHYYIYEKKTQVLPSLSIPFFQALYFGSNPGPHLRFYPAFDYHCDWWAPVPAHIQDRPRSVRILLP